MAREGADVTIVYLPEEQEDAEDTKKGVEQEGKSCLLVAGNLMGRNNCKHAVDEHVKTYVKAIYCLWNLFLCSRLLTKRLPIIDTAASTFS